MEFDLVQQLPPTDWATTAELMEHLRVKSPNTVTRMIRDGMPKHRVGRKYLFDLIEVDQWLRASSRWSERNADDGAA